MALLKLNKSGRKLLGFCPLLFLPSQSTPETIPQWQQKQLPTEKCKRQNSQEENPILSIWWWDQTLFLFLSLPLSAPRTPDKIDDLHITKYVLCIPKTLHFHLHVTVLKSI